jgi:tRNA pseudouridine55 synthase
VTSPAAGAIVGALVIDKPSGLTSHDVVAAVRRALREPRAGHTGTLDPFATGVLPVMLGPATRLARFLASERKAYEARVSFTGETDTDDATGTPRSGAAVAPMSRAALEGALASFRGSYLQVPPAYSARKVAGRRAYELARESAAPALTPTPVTVHSLELTDWEPPSATLHVVCSAGFYVRALARDLGRALGTGAHLQQLRRVASGPFDLRDAWPLDVVLREPDAARRRVIAPALAVAHLPAVGVGGQDLDRVLHGGDVVVASGAEGGGAEQPHGYVRLLDPGGALVGIAAPTTRPGVLHPVVVLM